MDVGGSGWGRTAWRAARPALLLPPVLFWLAVLAALTVAPGLLEGLAAVLDTLMWALLAALFCRDASCRFRC